MMNEVTEQQHKIDVHAAIRIARDYVLDLYKDTEIYDVLLEEVQRTDDDTFWLITIGLSHKPLKQSVRGARPQANLNELDELIEFTRHRTFERDYKVVKIHAQTGEVCGMTIRKLSA